MKRLAIVLALSLGALSGPGAAATSAASVRLPVSAADWASFTPTERAAAYAYVAAEYARLEASGKLVVRTVSTSAAAVDGAAAVTATSTTGYGTCGFNYVNTSGGTWTSAWASTTTTGAVPWIDTGVYAAQRDLFWRGNTQLDYFYAGGALNSTYVYASSSTNWKWWFEQVRYTVQSWHTAGVYGDPYVLGPLAYCSMNFSP